MARKQTANNETITVAKTTNQLKIRIDDLKQFEPLTENQKLFFDAYKRGDYFVALHGVAGTGKTFCALDWYNAIKNRIDNSIFVFI